MKDYIVVKNTCVNTLGAIKTMTGITSAASQYTGNDAKTVNQLDSDNSNTVQLNNNSLQYGETPQLEEFSFISAVLFNHTVTTLMITFYGYIRFKYLLGGSGMTRWPKAYRR